MKRDGQSIVEVLVSIGLGAIFVIGAATIIAPSLQISKQTGLMQTKTELTTELMNNAKIWAANNWNSVLTLATSSANTYRLNTSSSPFTVSAGTETVFVGTVSSTRYFYLGDVYRDSNGNVTTTVSGNTYDPSTKQITVVSNGTRNGAPTSTIVGYFTRNTSNVFDQTDWSGGSGYSGPTTVANSQFASSTSMNFGSLPGSLTASRPSVYSYYRTITVTSTANIASGTNTNFPMLVSSTFSSWAASANGGKIQNLVTAPNGVQEPADLVFATSTANCGQGNLNFETESYNSSTGALVDWVNVPTMATGTVIYACYYNAAVTTDQSHPSSTWDSNYAAVYHLPNGTTLNASDSTSNVNNATINSITATTTGEIDGAAVFTGVQNHYIGTQNVNLGTSFTVESWVSLSASIGANSPRIAENNAATGFFLGINGTKASGFSFIVDNNSPVTGGGSLPGGNTFYHVVGAYNGSIATLYVNGVKVSSSSVSNPTIGTSTISIGDLQAHNDSTASWAGVIDETRFSRVARSPSWILTEYNNQSNPNAFYTVSAETPRVPDGAISSSTNMHWAWNDAFGWIDFYNASSGIVVGSTGLTSYASSTVGPVSLDCATSPAGNICGTSNYQVTNDGSGNLAGWAWNDQYGWISFCGGLNSANCPGTIGYGVTIDSTGNFQGWAWSDVVGWIDFNCDNNSSCGTSNFEVQTTWMPPSVSSTATLDSAVFDTGVPSGAQFNSIGWQGTPALGSTVQFQFAASNSSAGPWNFSGTDGTSNTYYTPAAAGTPASLNYNNFRSFRYFRYRLAVPYANGTSSRVDDVLVNWSP